jgi:hypothetical protein
MVAAEREHAEAGAAQFAPLGSLGQSPLARTEGNCCRATLKMCFLRATLGSKMLR